MNVPRRAWPQQSFQFALFFFAYYGYTGIFTPYASLYFADKGMTVAQIGVLMSLMQVMRIFGPNFWGWVADYTQKRVLVLRLMALGATISVGGLFFGQTFAAFFIVMVLINTFTSPQGPLSEALMLAEMRGDLTYYGKLRLWGSIGFVVTLMLVGQVLDWIGIARMPWMAMLLLGIAWCASMRIKQSVQGASRSQAPSMAHLLRRREVWAFFISCFLMVAAHASLYVYYSLYLAQLGMSKGSIAFMWTLGVLAEILFFYYQAPIFKRFGIRALMLLGFAVAIIRFAMIGWGAQSFAILVFAQLLHAFSFAAHNSAAVMTIQQWFSGPLQARGQALFISISYGLGGTLGGLLLTLIWEGLGPQAVYYAASVFAVAGLLSACLYFRWQAHASNSLAS
ncbi:MFS transporter [Undibacterium terreum]|uniref:MFS transporter n=1 Tax=Undibacterium terreum TaxID=1224302 RepID=A0A916XS99_9BURK|nr:MFS transporter [Undibacterium terreum]GGC98523.1 MFS transporter [Undibacterium terreum]